MKTITTAGAAALVAFITLGTVRLVPVTTYGWEDLDTAHGPALTPAERAAGAAVLGHVTDAAEGRDGRVYVLDGMSKKVVIFAQDGSYQKIFGRDGRGPGEFVRPVKLAVSPSGSIYVFDRAIGRLSEFSQDGAFVRQVTLSDPNVADLAISDTIVWAARLLIAGGPPHLRAFRLSDGTAIQDFTGLTTEEMEVSSAGSAGRVLPYGQGGVLFVGPLPVVVRRYIGGRVEQFGSSLYPDA